MARPPATPLSPGAPPLSPTRLWAEQLAFGSAFGLALLIFLSFYHPKLLAQGMEVLTTNPLPAFGWQSWVGLAGLVLVHEAAALAAAWWWRVPLRWRLFGFGANAYATLAPLPRHPGRDAAIALAGPLTGTLASFACAFLYHATDYPLFLALACTGYFYNLFTLIPLLDLEGGWIAQALPPPAWLFGLFACSYQLLHAFNLVLLAVIVFGLPRFIALLRTRAPRTDLALDVRARVAVSLLYFALVFTLAWLGSDTFIFLRRAVPAFEGD